jgi:hypothetical protein
MRSCQGGPALRVAEVVGPPKPRDVLQQILGKLTVQEQAALRFHWPAWARAVQL